MSTVVPGVQFLSSQDCLFYRDFRKHACDPGLWPLEAHLPTLAACTPTFPGWSSFWQSPMPLPNCCLLSVWTSASGHPLFPSCQPHGLSLDPSLQPLGSRCPVSEPSFCKHPTSSPPPLCVLCPSFSCRGLSQCDWCYGTCMTSVTGSSIPL